MNQLQPQGDRLAPCPAPAWPKRWATAFAAWLPGLCAVCGQGGRGRVCAACRERFAAPRLRCAGCALPLASAAAASLRCGACLRSAPPFDAAACAVDYAFPWNRLVGALKFHAALDLAPTLAGMLAEAVRLADAPRPDLVLPVPLAPRRLAERGYNQAWELARRAAASRSAAARADLLQRLIDTPAQARLPRADRLANLRAAFAVAPGRHAEVAGRHIALVDDVMTTGATVVQAAAALRRAGAARVDVWVFARTPEAAA